MDLQSNLLHSEEELELVKFSQLAVPRNCQAERSRADTIDVHETPQRAFSQHLAKIYVGPERQDSERIQTISDSMNYLPSFDGLEALCSEITRDVHEAVRTLLSYAYTPEDRSTQLGKFLSLYNSPSICELCCTVYGVDTREQLLALVNDSYVDSAA